MWWFAFVAIVCVQYTAAHRHVEVTNKNGFDIWVATETFIGSKMPGVTHLKSDAKVKYNIPDEGWSGNFWPKIGCDANGANCEAGQSIEPCPPKGCQPAADTKVRFYFPPIQYKSGSWYMIDLVSWIFTFWSPFFLVYNHSCHNFIENVFYRFSWKAFHCPLKSFHIKM